MIIQICSREQNKKPIIDYFDKIGQQWFVSKLPAGDYMNPQNTKTIIELKHSHNDGCLELCGNLCNVTSHQRFVKEIDLAKKIGCENFYILIVNDKLKTIDDINNWSSKYSRVNGSTLLKIIRTMEEKYKIKFLLCRKEEMGAKIVELLTF